MFSRGYVGSGKVIRNIIKKHGKDVFQVQLLEIASSKDHLEILEKSYIALYKKLGKSLYNISNGGYCGPMPSGRPKSTPPSHMGVTRSAETRRKMSAAKRGKRPNEETRLKMSLAAQKRRRPHSEETKRKMSETRLRKQIRHSPEVVALIASKLRGRKHETSPETRQKISTALKGHHVSQETRDKISKKLKKLTA
jgi:group I intron endonuclease